MIPDPKATVTPGGICIETDEEGKQKGVLVIESKETDRILLYKLKTNAPQKYAVRQSVGMLLPGQHKEITVRPKAGSDKSDDKFQLEIRTAAAGEEATLRGHAAGRDMSKYEDAERDLVSKMWKEGGGEVARNQYLLLLQGKGEARAEAVPKKKPADANKEWAQRDAKPAEGSVEKLVEERENLEKKRGEATSEVKTLEEANKVAEKRTAPRKSFPLTVPLWLSLLLIIAAFGAGMLVSTTANDMKLTPSPLLTDYLNRFSRPLPFDE